MSEHERNVWQSAWRLLKLRRWRNHLGWKLLFISIIAASWYALAVPTVAKAYPVPGGCRYPTYDCGYFIGRSEPEPYDFVFPCGLFDSNKTSFENDIINYTNGAIPAGQRPPNCAPNLGLAQYQAGGAFIILTMLGYPPGTPKSVARQPGVQATWKLDVDYYASQGWIDFSYRIPNNFDNCRNTAYQINSPDVASLQDCQTGVSAIRFKDPGSPGHYVIKQACGNPIGDLSALSIPPASCAGTAPIIGLQPGDPPFTVTVKVKYASGVPPPYTAFHINVAGVPSYINNNAGVNRSNPYLTFTTPNLNVPPPGNYPITWQLFDSATPESPVCNGSYSVASLPYFSVFGADIEAGGDFGTCSTAGGHLESWYNNLSGATAGSNTFLAAIAAAQIYGVASAQAQNGASPRPTGLTFANSGAGAGGITTGALVPQLGGFYGGDHCFYDPQISGTPNSTATSGTVGSATLSDQAYTFTPPGGKFTLNGGSVGVGKNLAVYVVGNVYITGDITLAGAGIGGGWSMQPDGSTNVPSFTLRATGNIYIKPSVGTLDGSYIADGTYSGGGGTIYTCSDSGGFGPDTDAAGNIYGDCKKVLTVHGTFTAKQINLMRTSGTLNEAMPDDNLSNSPQNCVNNPVQEPVCAAEVFDFSPEMYLSNPAVTPSNNGAPSYDSVTSLPPVL